MKSPFRLSLISLAILAPTASAEEISLYHGDEVVVTATRTPQPVSAVLNDISVITAEEIAKAGQSTLAELLQSQPGVEMAASGGLGQPSSIYLRGANSGHTLVLIDGMRVDSATFGMTAIEHIPLSQVQRIEILRGPASALYGSDAIGGVVQIFTKTGSGTPRPNFSVGLGSYNTQNINGGVAGEINGTRFSLQAGYVSSDGFSAIGNPANSHFNPDRDGYRNNNVTANLVHQVTPGNELGLNVFYANARTHYDDRPAADDYQDHRLSVYSIQSRNRLRDNWESLLRIGSSSDDSVAVDSNPGSFRTDQNQFYWQNNITTGMGLLTAGVERVEQKVVSSNVYDKTSRTDDSLLLGYQGRFGLHSLEASARHDDNSQFGGHDTGMLAYGYRFTPQWRASASLGTAFKAPTFNDLYWPGAGNPNLQPERARNREIAVHYDDARQSASAVYFDNQVADLIAWAPISPGSWTWAPANVNQASLRGTTFSWAGQIDRLRLDANLTLQEPKDAVTGKLLVNRARQHGALKINRAMGSWDFGGELVFSGERFGDAENTQRMGGYGVANLTARYALSKTVSLKGRINNLFDKQYELVKDNNTPGANLFVGLEYQPR
ncbi:MAG: TonB-dependent receptor [Sulfuricella sp.]|nr:TonB-dependent receptor [Sulfuricella sp.]